MLHSVFDRYATYLNSVRLSDLRLKHNCRGAVLRWMLPGI